MTTSTPKFPRAIWDSAETSEALAALVQSLGNVDFGERLLAFLRTQNDFDSAMVMSYHPQRRPQLLAEALAHPLRRNSAEAYVSGAYLLDPMFQHSSLLTCPVVVRLEDIAPADFLDSEYVRSYYEDSNIVDEVNYLVPAIEQSVYAVCLERSRSRPAFDVADMQRFRNGLPLVNALFHQHRNATGRDAQHANGDNADPEHDRLQAVLANFGKGRLTQREQQIAQLLLRGRSTPVIAMELRVSAQTVRVHRRNIYDKLDISSLGELFTLAMHSLVGARS